MEWRELYNPNGLDTVTAVISNPNDVPIDVGIASLMEQTGRVDIDGSAECEVFFTAY